MIFFLTGATGFLGSNIARHLLSKGHTVRAIRRSTSRMDLIADCADHIDWFEGDVLVPESLDAGMAGAQGVIHAAASLGFEEKQDVHQLMDVNVVGSANVVDAAIQAGIGRLVHVSSIAALGRTGSLGRTGDLERTGEATDCTHESAEWRESALNTDYAVSKHRAEMEVHRGVAMGLDAVIINPSLIMGAGRLQENTMQIADRLVKKGIPFLPKGSTNVVDVRDVASGSLLAFEKGRSGERYILAGHNLLWRNILGILADALGVRSPTRTAPDSLMLATASIMEFGASLFGRQSVLTRENVRIAMTLSCYDNSRSRTELGCTYRPFEESAAWIAEHYKASHKQDLAT